MNNQNVQIIILAAGKGSRMKSDLPKPMHKISGRTMLEMVLDNARQVSDDITIVYSDAMRPYLESLQHINLILQPTPLGTGHAVYCAINSINSSESTIVLYADNPFIDADMITSILSEFHKLNSDMMVMAFERENPTGYGRLVLDGQNRVKKIIECKDASKQEKVITLCNSGIILFNSAALKETLVELMADHKSPSGEYYLTSLLEIAYKKGYKTSYFTASGAVPLGVNTQEELEAAEISHKKY